MNLKIFLADGQSMSVKGDYRGVIEHAPNVSGPLIELDELGDGGQRKMLLPDPRAYIIEDTGVVIYDPRNVIDLLPTEMRQWLNEHPEWPLKTLGRETDAVPWEKFRFEDIPQKNREDRHIKFPGAETFGTTKPTFENIDDIYSQRGLPIDSEEQEKILRDYRNRVLALLKLPIVKQYMAFNKDGTAVHDQPWHVLGQRIYAAAECLICAEGKMPLVGMIYEDDMIKRRAMIVATAWILEATPYLWLPEVEKVAQASQLPKHIISRAVLPNPVMFWSCRPSIIVAQWLLLFHARTGIMIFGSGAHPETNEHCIGYDFIDYGQTYPGDFQKPVLATDLLKRCAFLNSPYVDAEPRKMQRHYRRQLEREGMPKERTQETINVVKLRRRVIPAARKQQQPSGEHIGIEWQHQWWVSAHYRAQWYPTEQSHRVIWIEPYLKGPSDKPILEKIYAVIR